MEIVGYDGPETLCRRSVVAKPYGPDPLGRPGASPPSPSGPRLFSHVPCPWHASRGRTMLSLSDAQMDQRPHSGRWCVARFESEKEEAV